LTQLQFLIRHKTRTDYFNFDFKILAIFPILMACTLIKPLS